jgi:FKBP-type peptidyl-prolyl cis-trans isomerase 2
MDAVMVDFNSRDEYGRVSALAFPGAEVGATVFMMDDDGCSCRGKIATADDGEITIDAEWSTFSALL